MKNYIRYILVLQLFLAGLINMEAQPDRHDVRLGNRKFKKEKWAEADIAYRKALVKDSLSFAANYNLANNLYRQGNMQEASSYMGKLKETAPDSPHGADYYYNVGDIAIAQKDWKGAVEAFKQALLRTPWDMEAKENYIYAKKMLENKENNDKNQNKDQDKNQDKDQNKDQDKDQNKDQNKDDQNKPDENKGENNQKQQNEGQGEQDMKISPQQAQQMLKAIQAKEKETQEKVNKEKAAVLKSRQKEKNW